MTDSYTPLVMIVEDTHYIGELAALILKRIGLEAELCLTAEDAIKYMEDVGLPDLIVLDIMLPGMDGYEVCEKIRQQKEFNAIRIIFLSAMARSIDIAKGMGLAADDYITKPFAIDYVVGKVNALLAENS